MTETVSETSSWRELLGQHLGMSTLLAGGVLLYSTNEFLTVSMLPTIIADIGGARLFSWATTLYLIGSVVSAALVYPILQRIGARRAYLIGLTVFALASVVNVLAPSMAVLVAGRALRGVSGGLLAGLGYALINTALPRSLWTRGSALVSAMWGVPTLIGPVAGGIFAQLGLWRWAYVAIGVAAGLMALLVVTVLKPDRIDPAGERAVTPSRKVPLGSLLLMSSAALTVSVAALPHRLMENLAVLLAGGLLVVAFILVDRRTSVAVLPRSVFGPGPAKWIYLTMSVQMAAAMANTYVPLFGQKLADLSPAEAGFLGAALATGWTGSEIVSASLTDRRVIGRVVVAGPLIWQRAWRWPNPARIRPARDCRPLGAGTADHRGRHRDRLAASDGACDGFRRPRTEQCGRRGDQHRAAGLCGLRGRSGGCGGQPDRGRRCDGGSLVVSGFRGAGGKW